MSEVVLGDLKIELARTIGGVKGTSGLDEVFVYWLVGELVSGLSVSEAVSASLRHKGAQRSYRDVAILGFASTMGEEREISEALRKGVQWVSGRKPFLDDSSAVGFEMDPVALLGIALGARSAGSESVEAVHKWIDGFIARSFDLFAVASWERTVLGVVANLVGVECASSSVEPGRADVRMALRAKGLPIGEGNEDVESEERAALLALRNDDVVSGVPLAAFRLKTVDWILRLSPIAIPERITVSQIAAILRRVPAGLAHWTWEEKARTRGGIAEKWDIRNEYHVQNLLWAILAPLLPDLLAEDYTGQVGHLQPRADIGIPSLRTIIEVKFMRAAASFAEIVEQIASDANLYLTDSSAYDEMVVFVWDDSRRTEQHDRLYGGLRQLRGITDAVIVSRPGLMTGNGGEKIAS